MTNKEFLPKNLSVLLVEDDPIAQRVCALFLQDIHYKVATADCGEQALTMMDEKYDIIFLDIGLPDIDGYQVARSIRAFEEQQQRKPVHIVAITAHIYDSAKAECFAVGINDFIGKPISKESLYRVLMDFAINR
jgi:CheY-like chemotaxis protein